MIISQIRSVISVPCKLNQGPMTWHAEKRWSISGKLSKKWSILGIIANRYTCMSTIHNFTNTVGQRITFPGNHNGEGGGNPKTCPECDKFLELLFNFFLRYKLLLYGVQSNMALINWGTEERVVLTIAAVSIFAKSTSSIFCTQSPGGQRQPLKTIIHMHILRFMLNFTYVHIIFYL